MNISVLSQRVPYPPNKGEKLRTYHQIERMVDLGHTVSVVSFSEGADDEQQARALEAALGVTVMLYPLPGKLTRYTKALLRGLPISVGAFYSPQAARVIHQQLASPSLDMLFLSASSLSYYVFSSKSYQQTRCKLVMDFMDVDSDKWRQYAHNARWPMSWVYQRESRGIRRLEQQVNKWFAHSFLIAKEEVELFKRTVCHEHPITVLGNGLDFSAFTPVADQEKVRERHFLFTGVMDYKPNIDAVLWFVRQCWPGIKKQLPDATFTIAGMNPSQEVKAFNNKQGIEITGFVEDILPYFHAAAVFVAPFRLARGVQNKVLQAAACKVPLVCTSMGAEGIGFASSDTMAIADSAEAFTEACIIQASQRGEALAKAQRALDIMLQEYSWEQQLTPLEKILKPS